METEKVAEPSFYKRVMQKIKHFVYNKSTLVVIELIVFAVCAMYSIATYSEEEFVFSADDMEVQDLGGHYEGGGVSGSLIYG